MGDRIRQGIENTAGLLIPPACREEVLGDLHERSRTSPEFCIEALSVIPLVILSRVRRTMDPQVLPLHAAVAYLSFWAAAWFEQRALVETTAGLLKVALAAAAVLLAVLLEDAYAKPGKRLPSHLIRGPFIGVLLAMLLELSLWFNGSQFALPLSVVLFGSALALVLSSALRLLFSSQSTSPQGPQGT
jgi:hypothetical protein